MDVEVGRHGRIDGIEEAAELGGAMSSITAAEDVTGGDIEGGEQRRRAMPPVVVVAPLSLPERERQERLGTVERLHLALLVEAQHQGMIGRAHIETDNVAHLSMNSGSVDSLKVSVRCGCSPKARQMR